MAKFDPYRFARNGKLDKEVRRAERKALKVAMKEIRRTEAHLVH